MSHIARRVSRLENAAGNPHHARQVVEVIVQPGEDEDDVIARWCAEHPEMPVEDVFFIVRVIVSPQHREVRP